MHKYLVSFLFSLTFASLSSAGELEVSFGFSNSWFERSENWTSQKIQEELINSAVENREPKYLEELYSIISVSFQDWSKSKSERSYGSNHSLALILAWQEAHNFSNWIIRRNVSQIPSDNSDSKDIFKEAIARFEKSNVDIGRSLIRTMIYFLMDSNSARWRDVERQAEKEMADLKEYYVKNVETLIPIVLELPTVKNLNSETRGRIVYRIAEFASLTYLEKELINILDKVYSASLKELGEGSTSNFQINERDTFQEWRHRIEVSRLNDYSHRAGYKTALHWISPIMNSLACVNEDLKDKGFSGLGVNSGMFFSMFSGTSTESLSRNAKEELDINSAFSVGVAVGTIVATTIFSMFSIYSHS